MTAAAVVLVVFLVAAVGLWLAAVAELRDERREYSQYRRMVEEAERQRVARRRRLGLPVEDDA
jgi:hypothetical protein